MAKPSLTANELRELIATELRKDAAYADVDPDSLIILKTEPGWWATIRNDGSRLDEARLAAVAEVSRRLAAGFDLAGATHRRSGLLGRQPDLGAQSAFRAVAENKLAAVGEHDRARDGEAEAYPAGCPAA
jgi:hypothetical protein